MRKNMQLNPLGDGLAFLAMISWGCYSALIKKIGEWEYPTWPLQEECISMVFYF